jgi:uncharacterized protein (DUF58 family)
MLTRRGNLVLALGAGLYLVAWAFGSRPLYPVAVGLVLAVALAWAWVRLLNRPMRLRRAAWGAEHFEGDDVPVNLELEVDGRPVPSALPVVDTIDGLGTWELLLRRGGRRLVGRYVARRVPRGRYPFGEARVLLQDPFALERTIVRVPAAGALVVYPRLTELGQLFSDAGAYAQDGRRLLLRRPSGFDLHSVREYEEGESLRRVHWRSTARRGQLMVKELEDAPRDEVAVLLDATAGVVAGEPPDSSFDMQVRAAGSILGAHARRGRRAVLVINSMLRETQHVQAAGGEWQRVLELLAAAQPSGRTPAAALLAEDASAAARAYELTVVTAALSAELVERLLQRSLNRRGVALVYVDAASFASPPRERAEPALLRLARVGVPVAVLRRGDDLAAKLGGRVLERTVGGAHG